MKITKHTTPAEAWAAFVGDKCPKEMLAGSRFPDAVAEGYVFGCPLAESMTDAQRRRLASLLEQHMMPHVAARCRTLPPKPQSLAEGARMTLTDHRLSLGVNKRQMAESLGVHVTTWCKWELFNDPKGRRACGLPVDVEDLKCRSVNVSLSPAAHARWAAMPAGQRSKWVSALIEGAP